MDLLQWISGRIGVRLICADPACALAALCGAGIPVYDAVSEDMMTICFSIERKDMARLSELAQRKGFSLQTVRFSGMYWLLQRGLRRPVLTAGCLVLLLLALVLPSRILFVRVEGNSRVPSRLILEQAEQCGICFGASRRQVRSERMKNALLDAVEELQWAGVNTQGCVAVIHVRERSEPEEEPREQESFSSILALRDGVITRCTVTKGTPLCQTGQAVRKGQVLVSGYRDCGICIQAGAAEAEIYARTERKLEAVLPVQWTSQQNNGRQEKKYALIIGKKRINFYKGSGISGSSCDKMYSTYSVCLPGGFVLPVCLVTEVCYGCDESAAALSTEQAESVLKQFAGDYLRQHMTAGLIQLSKETVAADPDRIRLLGNYACEEMIAQVKREEIIKPDGEHD